MKILLLDNYDSFTYNLLHIVRELGYDADVIRNDKIKIEDVNIYDKIILSPGPGIPSESGLLLPIIKQYAPYKSILGICLGEQAIGESFGATLANLDDVFHGIQTPVEIVSNDYIFDSLPSSFLVGRYHSWVVEPTGLPHDLIITATDNDGKIMGLKHAEYDVHGVQFHPESVLTPNGFIIIKNFLMH